LFFAVMGAQVLGFPQVTAILSAILELGGSVLFGGAIIVAGFFIAMIIGRILSGTVSTVVRWAVIILFTAMGLQSMGVADSIIEMAFGALVIGGAAAAVLAFGLGAREAAARPLAKLEQAQPADPAPAAAGAAPVHRSPGRRHGLRGRRGASTAASLCPRDASRSVGGARSPGATVDDEASPVGHDLSAGSLAVEEHDGKDSHDHPSERAQDPDPELQLRYRDLRDPASPGGLGRGRSGRDRRRHRGR